MIELRNRSRGTVVAARVEEATRFLARLRGLLGRDGLAEGEGLLIAPCTSIHTFFMRFPIDVLFLGEVEAAREGERRAGDEGPASGSRVLRAIPALRPWRATRIYPKATCVVELAPGALARSATQEGDLLSALPALRTV